MLRNSEGETEILLGNKQLLGLFAVVVCLLGIAFTGGYKIGQGSKRPVASGTALSTATDEASSGAATGTAGGVTQQLPGDAGTPPVAASSPEAGAQTETVPPPATHSAADEDAAHAMPKPAAAKAATNSATPRTKTHHEESRDLEASEPPTRTAEPLVHEVAGFAPQTGQMFLQVAAVGRDEAEGIAEVLRKKGFRAHAVPKPGSHLYRVIIGPVRDNSDLNSTRSQLRNNAGFREIIVQRY